MTAIRASAVRVPASPGRLRLGRPHHEARLRALRRRTCSVMLLISDHHLRGVRSDKDLLLQLGSHLPRGAKVLWTEHQEISLRYAIGLQMTEADRLTHRFPEWISLDRLNRR